MQGIFDLNGQRAVVTGGSRGLGYGMAEAFLEEEIGRAHV